jgi:superfamily II DNA or RNA helicase
MTSPTIRVQTKPLRRARDLDEFLLYRAALEWGLVDPVIINNRDDLKSEARWKDRVEPYHHQVTNLITYCRRLPVTLLADDVGLGKTISAGLIASELIARRRVNKLLIVAPKLLGPQWKEELETKFDIPAEIAIGNELLDADPDDDVGAVITTYHTARQYIKRIPSDRFEMLILDEAHKLRNLYGVPEPPQVALRFREVLAERAFRFVLMLTATPIQNRLWDLYSLVDLLTVARGHQNPFGGTGMFARRFIADNSSDARHLKLEAREEFRSIIYGYMSRVRRGDANLHFPDRKVYRQGVSPTREELQLIGLIAKPIQKLNRLAQISILQALTSSPDACATQLENMARRGTFSSAVARQFRGVVKSMPLSAKLQGVAALVSKLQRENPQSWRMVVFTQRRETQTTIQAYLESRGISVGIINGDTMHANQSTIAQFKASPPKIHVLVSTEAGAEGVNLQAANVLVNYDLPWNPMIVEQRVGRVQRLGSDHAHVVVYSITLSGTFEDYIVGRLMQKLQMATHAIGDIESLLEASGMGDGDNDGTAGFENHILQLVLDSLAGKDVEAAALAAEESIDQGRQTLIEEEKNIDEMLGVMDGAAYKGPRSPDLPAQPRSLAPGEFVLAGLASLGAKITKRSPDVFACVLDGRREMISISDGEAPGIGVTRFMPGSPPFDRLVGRLTQSGMHHVEDADVKPAEVAMVVAAQWAGSFGATVRAVRLSSVERQYSGDALLQVRATVAHDSYERLIAIDCPGEEHSVVGGKPLMDPMPPVIDQPEAIGLSIDRIQRLAVLDPAIAEFCRFYIERRTEEMRAAGNDPRLAKKLEDDFTPRLEATLTGLNGRLQRILEVAVTYSIDAGEYTSTLRILTSKPQIINAPSLGICAKTNRSVPIDALSRCDFSNKQVLKHLLVKSAASDRYCLPEHMAVCSLSGQTVLQTEVEASDFTGNPVLRTLLKKSAVSGQKAEPQHFGKCAFTQIDALRSELVTSGISGKDYRSDQTRESAISGKKGHVSEFISCPLSGRLMAPGEGERCSITGQGVFPGLLQECAVTHSRVLPQLLDASNVSGRKALRDRLVTSSISKARCLPEEAVTSSHGRACTRSEAITCAWSGEVSHPEDVQKCELIDLPIRASDCTRDQPRRLAVLAEMLCATRQAGDRRQDWNAIAALAASRRNGRFAVESAQQSPDGSKVAVCVEQKTLLGLRTRYLGFLYSLTERAIVGRVVTGKRSNGMWSRSD